jgi:hypothetical protein
VEARFPALFEAVDDSRPKKVRPHEVQKLIKSLKLTNAFGIHEIPRECLRRLPRRPHISSDTRIYLLLLAVAFSVVLEGSKRDNLTEDEDM